METNFFGSTSYAVSVLSAPWAPGPDAAVSSLWLLYISDLGFDGISGHKGRGSLSALKGSVDWRSPFIRLSADPFGVIRRVG